MTFSVVARLTDISICFERLQKHRILGDVFLLFVCLFYSKYFFPIDIYDGFKKSVSLVVLILLYTVLI